MIVISVTRPLDQNKNLFFFYQVAEVKKMKIGDPLDRSTSHGPQNHRAHLEKLVEYCDIGIKEGATLVHGGKQADMPGQQMFVF